MGAPATASIARASDRAGSAASAGATGARTAPVVSGLPAYMQVVDAGAAAGAARGRIQALQQQEETDDRSVAEDLADRVGLDDARQTMQAQDARTAAQSDVAQRGQDEVRQAAQADSAPMSFMQRPEDQVSRMGGGDAFDSPGAWMMTSGEGPMSRADGRTDGTSTPIGAPTGPGQRMAGAAGGGTTAVGFAAGGAQGAQNGRVGAGGAAAASNGGAVGADQTGKQASKAEGAAAETQGDELADDVPRDEAPPADPDTGAGALDTGDLVLIDVELAEHQRWAAAESVVGEAWSIERIEWVAETAGEGAIGGVASGAAMGLGIGLVQRYVPKLLPVVNGGLALHSLLTRDWAATGATIGKFGQGNDAYQMLGNSLRAVSTVVEIVANVVDTIGLIALAVEGVAAGVAAGAGVLAFFTFGATAGIAVAAGELAATCEEIREACTAVSFELNEINTRVLQPCIPLFFLMHDLSSQSDPRELEDDKQDLQGATGAIGGVLGGWIGGRAAAYKRGVPPPADGDATPQRPPHDSPPAPDGDAPEVHFKKPPVIDDQAGGATGSPLPEPDAVPDRFMGVSDTAGPAPESLPTPEPVAKDSGTSGSGDGEQLAFPGMLDPPAPGQSRWRQHRPPPREQTPGEIAPPDTHSAALRRLRAEAAGEADTLVPGTDVYNIARHDPPDARGTPRDLYQPSPRPDPSDGLIAQESHHLESQTYQKDKARGIANYRADQDTTVDLPTKAHYKLKGPQKAMETKTQAPITRRQLGTGNAIEQTTNLIQYRSLTEPAPVNGKGPKAWLPKGVAGQTAVEHTGYQFGRSPLSEPTLPIKSPVWEHPGPHPLASETIKASGLPVEDVDWEGSFNQPDPARQAAPPGTQFGLFGVDTPPPASGPRQLELPLPERPWVSRDQMELPFASGHDGHGNGGSPEHLMPIGEGDNPRNDEPLTPEQFQEAQDTAVEFHAPRENVQQARGRSGYSAGLDLVKIGPDIYPAAPGTRTPSADNPANAALSMRAAVAHEVIGHREAALGGATQDEEWHEEAQASARAAVHATGLPREQEFLLLQDSHARTRHNSNEGTIFLNMERFGPAAEAQAPAKGPMPASDVEREPTVIVDRSLKEPGEPAPVASAAHRPAPVSIGARAQQAAAFFLPQFFGAEGPGYEEQRAAHRAEFTTDNQPAEGVERVNPHYSSPPGTPDQIVALQNEILNLLAVRARAEAESRHEEARIAACEDNQAPIAATLADTRGGISAVRAHQQAIARHGAANQAQQQRQEQTARMTGDYAGKAEGLRALETPLSAWEGFTSIASHLPGSAGDKMAQMNAEATRMHDSIDHMDSRMAGADGAQPGRAAELADHAQRIAATGEQAQSTHKEMQSAEKGAAGLQSANDAALAAAQERQQAANDRGDELGAAADERQAQADSLAAQMRAWAQIHRDERAQAIAATTARLQGEGKIVTESPPE